MVPANIERDVCTGICHCAQEAEFLLTRRIPKLSCQLQIVAICCCYVVLATAIGGCGGSKFRRRVRVSESEGSVAIRETRYQATASRCTLDICKLFTEDASVGDGLELPGGAGGGDDGDGGG